MGNKVKCPSCDSYNDKSKYFCSNCGSFLKENEFENKQVYTQSELRIKRILDNMKINPHLPISWDSTVDMYSKKVELFKRLLAIQDVQKEEIQSISDKFNDFLKICRNPEFQIAFVGTIKTGKSTLINSLLGHNYASMAVTPETAVLTKFRSSDQDYVKVIFYTKEQWEILWKSISSGADTFMEEYKSLNADKIKNDWIGHKPFIKYLANSEIEEELSKWSSSKSAEHYFVSEIEVGISTLPKDFPKQVVFVDTPGLSDPVGYRSAITRKYIKNANSVFVCVDAQKVQKEEIETISSVFSFSSNNKSKVHIIATHWDKLNDPIEDWKEQKEWLEKRLVGKGFFDTKEMAHTNILHSASYIYNLCRDYENISKKEKKAILMFSMQFERFEDMEVEECLSDMMDLTNVNQINDKIRTDLLNNYVELLTSDIEKKYFEIIYDVRRYSNNKIGDLQKVIEASNENINNLQKRLSAEQKNYDEVKRCKEQLNAVIKSVDKITQKRLNTILKKLDKSV